MTEAMGHYRLRSGIAPFRMHGLLWLQVHSVAPVPAPHGKPERPLDMLGPLLSIPSLHEGHQHFPCNLPHVAEGGVRG